MLALHERKTAAFIRVSRLPFISSQEEEQDPSRASGLYKYDKHTRSVYLSAVDVHEPDRGAQNCRFEQRNCVLTLKT